MYTDLWPLFNGRWGNGFLFVYLIMGQWVWGQRNVKLSPIIANYERIRSLSNLISPLPSAIPVIICNIVGSTFSAETETINQQRSLLGHGNYRQINFDTLDLQTEIKVSLYTLHRTEFRFLFLPALLSHNKARHFRNISCKWTGWRPKKSHNTTKFQFKRVRTHSEPDN